MEDETTDTMRYRVVLTADGQYGVWPAERALPAGWTDEGTLGSRDFCLDRIEAHLREAVGG